MPERFELDEELHAAGQHVSIANKSITQALAWWVGAELVRRHPKELRLLELHPAGGMYDCLSVLRIGRQEGAETHIPLHMNMNPRAHLTVFPWNYGERLNWLEVLLCSDRRSYVVEQLERVMGLTPPPGTPATQPSSIGPLLISAFLQRTILGPARWLALNGQEDSASDFSDPGARSWLFEKIPAAKPAARLAVEHDLDANPHYRFWFLLKLHRDKEGTPRFAVDTWTGQCFIGSDTPIDLMHAYDRVGRSVDALASSILPPAF